eukprot:14801165-Heterocapsa_arctica.AAC.1
MSVPSEKGEFLMPSEKGKFLMSLLTPSRNHRCRLPARCAANMAADNGGSRMKRGFVSKRSA